MLIFLKSYERRSPKITNQLVQVPSSSNPRGHPSVHCTSSRTLNPEVLLTPVSLFPGSHPSLPCPNLSKLNSAVFSILVPLFPGGHPSLHGPSLSPLNSGVPRHSGVPLLLVDVTPTYKKSIHKIHLTEELCHARTNVDKILENTRIIDSLHSTILPK